MNDYGAFLYKKAHVNTQDGFVPTFIPEYLFDFQKSLIDWAVRQGRGALLEDCGMGKTVQQLVWAENVVRHTNGRVLVMTPLAVAAQTVREAEKFGIDAFHSRDGKLSGKIIVTNYEQLDKFDPSDFVGVVCDESSILKSFDGSRKAQITAFMRKLRFRLLGTATAAPNDYVELGTSSEALGYLGHMDMLNRFFKNDQNNSATKRMYGKASEWRFKGHAELPFWQWVCSWARAVRKPSDIGFDDDAFVLPPLTENMHVVKSAEAQDGFLLNLPAIGLAEERKERRRTLDARCAHMAGVVDTGKPAVVWCNLNDEGDLLESTIPDAVQVSGADKDEAKEEKFLAFANGDIRVLVTKPKIGAWGLNWQHCSHVAAFPTHSFEQYYQLVRRCWRFGQENEVVVDVVAAEGEANVIKNLHRKADQAATMFDNLVAEMNRSMAIDNRVTYKHNQEVPKWL